MNLLTSVQAAELHGTAASTTRNAAAAGRVAGARQIGGTWVATEAEWREWYETRRPAGRPKKEAPAMWNEMDAGTDRARHEARIGRYTAIVYEDTSFSAADEPCWIWQINSRRDVDIDGGTELTQEAAQEAATRSIAGRTED
jgi:hypothetical protein